jgi:hypothetical protein
MLPRRLAIFDFAGANYDGIADAYQISDISGFSIATVVLVHTENLDLDWKDRI